MKATSRQGRHLPVNHFSTAPLSHTLRSKSARSLLGYGKRLKNSYAGSSSLQKKLVRTAMHSGAAKKYKFESANDATIEQLQETLVEAGAILATLPEAADESALRIKEFQPGEANFSSILPFDHPKVMAYISSCLQDNSMIYVSPQIANLGFSPEAWLGKTDLRLQQVHKDDFERVNLALQRSRNTGEKFNCHYRLYDSEGKIHWIHDEASMVRGESGSPLFISGVMLDITDKKEMEAELDEHRHCLEQRVELRTRQLMKSIALLQSCNARLCEKLTLTRSELAALKRLQASPAMQQKQSIQATPAAISAPIIQTTKITQTYDCVKQPDGLSVWAQKMINLTHDNWVANGCYKPETRKPAIPPAPSFPGVATLDCIEQLEGISDWARNMIGWRVTAAGAIS